MTALSHAVIYLARGRDAGLRHAHAFLRSLDSSDPAGGGRGGEGPHGRYLLAKGWEDDPVSYRTLREDFAGWTVIDLPDDGFDLGAYFRALPAIREDVLVVFNTFSRIEHPACVSMLASRAARDGVGLVGCTASWGTLRPGLSQGVAVARAVAAERGPVGGLRELARRLSALPAEIRATREAFPPFPNPHVRTNAFAVTAALFRDFAAGSAIPLTKPEVCALETGWHGLTRFVLGRGLKVEVLSAEGTPFGPDRFLESRTFRAGPSTRSLVSDNATRAYADLPPLKKHVKEIAAWGRTVS